MVRQIIETFDDADDLIIVIVSEGNRSYVHQWKTGFYHIAAGAGVPIVLDFLDSLFPSVVDTFVRDKC